ncbi:MAG: RNA polymerase sigma-70 factor (ECF subfamily) [Verrucomicrobiales bacterium]|jgi:RNA polymerase sigma-70 factor (ECF subfamily)
MPSFEIDDWKQLVQQTRDGDSGAGHQLVERLYPTVIKIVRNHRPVAIDEEDLAQEVFMKVFSKLDTWRGLQPLEHWVARISRNTCFDHLRKKKRRGELRYADLSEEEESVIEQLLTAGAETDQQIDSTAEVHQLLEKLLATLKPAEERVLRMLDLERLAVKDIAEQLKWGESRVKVTAFRARKKLQATLKEMEGGLNHET